MNVIAILNCWSPFRLRKRTVDLETDNAMQFDDCIVVEHRNSLLRIENQQLTVLALKRVIIGRVLRDERTLAIILDHY